MEHKSYEKWRDLLSLVEKRRLMEDLVAVYNHLKVSWESALLPGSK